MEESESCSQGSGQSNEDFMDLFPKELPEGSMLKWLSLTVSEPEKRTGTSLKMQETFIVYLVESKVTDPSLHGYGKGSCSVWRRYSEFELLKNYLAVIYPAIVIPPIPEKRVSYSWQQTSTDKFDPDFLERRRVGLENYVLRIASHPILCQDDIFHWFLKQLNGWKESVHATDFQKKADSKLKALSVSYRLKRPNRQFEEIKNYGQGLQTNVGNILKTRAKIAKRLYGIHKIHGNYGRVFSEWSCIEKEMGDGLQSAGHFVDVYSSSIESMLEDEEQFADQIKEYLSFGDSIRNVCKKQELYLLSQEKAEDSLTAKKKQREDLAEGKTRTLSFSGFKSKLFGGDSPEQRELKLKQLDEQIAETEELVKQTTQETQKFVDEALKDIERFERQKVRDMKEILTNYSLIQIDQCKKGIQVWQNVKECFDEKM